MRSFRTQESILWVRQNSSNAAEDAEQCHCTRVSSATNLMASVSAGSRQIALHASMQPVLDLPVCSIGARVYLLTVELLF
jgi:hypothetical protein